MHLRAVKSPLCSLATHDKHFHLLPDAISDDEEKELLSYVEPLLRRRRYEQGHWDSVITQYKEVELLPVSRGLPMPSGVQKIFQRLQRLIQANYKFDIPQFLNPHCIDLSDDGHIDFHVDSTKHSGGVLVGLSLLADRTMALKRDAPDSVDDSVNLLQRGVVWSAAEVKLLTRVATGALDLSGTDTWDHVARALNGTEESKDKKFLRSAQECRAKYASLYPNDDKVINLAHQSDKPDGEDNGQMRVVLPRRSLYMLEGPLRYSYAHAILPGDRRLSVIFRDPAVEGEGDRADAGLRKVS